jgi:hypothetical protein
MCVDKKGSEFMLMPLLTIWQEMGMIISLNIVQETIIGVLKIRVEDRHIGAKAMHIKIGLLQEVDPECRCRQFLTGPMIFIVLDL